MFSVVSSCHTDMRLVIVIVFVLLTVYCSLREVVRDLFFDFGNI